MKIFFYKKQLKRYVYFSLLMICLLLPKIFFHTSYAQHNKPFIQSDSGFITASIMLDKKAEKIWELITNYEKMAAIMPDIKNAQIIKSNGDSALIRYTFYAPYTFGRTIDALIKVDEQPNYFLGYKLIQSKNIISLNGHWVLIPFGDHTLLSHRVYIEPKIPYFLKSLFFKYFKNNLNKSILLIGS